MWGGGRKTYAAHRISWMMASGQDIPPGMLICHTCDNRCCVNPSHLFLGTHRDNNLDTQRKGRGNHPIGLQCSWTKVNWQAVHEVISSSYERGANKAFAKKFGISRALVTLIRQGKRWPQTIKLLKMVDDKTRLIAGNPSRVVSAAISSEASKEERSTTIPQGSRAKWLEVPSTAR